MPNWVTNSLTIQDSPEVIKQVAGQLSAPYDRPQEDMVTNVTTMETVSKPFSFWNILKPTNVEEYDKPADRSQFENPNNWYNWNIAHWGTKWDAVEPDVIDTSDDSITYGFDTAWSPPIPVVLELSRQYPTAKITLDFREEQSWGGHMDFLDGDITRDVGYEWSCFYCDYEATEGKPEGEFCDDCDATVCPSCHQNYEDKECPHTEELFKKEEASV